MNYTFNNARLSEEGSDEMSIRLPFRRNETLELGGEAVLSATSCNRGNPRQIGYAGLMTVTLLLFIQAAEISSIMVSVNMS